MRFVLLLALGLPQQVDFGREIRPLLSDRCFRCHGPDAAARRGKLRLDSFAAANAERGGYRALVPGDPSASELIARVTSADPDERMPPPDSKLVLTSEEIELLRRWVKEGAEYQEPWFAVPPRRYPAPTVAQADWPLDELDRFVLADLEAAGLEPAPPAGREAWIRRVSFDLTGLSPTPEEIDAFLADDSSEAHGKVVERLLASPRFGERMASDWLDVARYADTYGYQNDVERRVWPWRDWVVEAFRENLPWNEFVTWQLAGDLLENPTREQRLATAFNRLHRQTNEGGSVEEEFRVEYVSDRVHTFGTAFLGLTLECARCHDHKYDPIEQRDYYRLFAFFDDIDESGLYSHFTGATPTPTLLLSTAEQEAGLAEARQRVAAAEQALQALEGSRAEAYAAWRATLEPPLPGPGAHFSFEAISAGELANLGAPDKPGRVQDAPTLDEGPRGRALLLSGDDNAHFPAVGEFTRNDPFTLALWMRSPEPFERAVVLHRSRSWTDAGSQGYQLLIEDGRLSAALIHFWPGDAICVRSLDPLPVGEWLHVALRYDGSSLAAGLELFLNGARAETEVIRDRLVRGITGGGDLVLTVGQRFRDRGFRGGRVDELMVFDRRLAEAEIRALVHGEPAEDLESYLAGIDPPVAAAREALREERAALARRLDEVPEIMTMAELPEPRVAYLLRRGSYLAREDPLEPGTPAFLGPLPAELPPDRLGLARWLTSDEHPLLARVTVNRFWQLLFGTGLVASTENFGSQGTPPQLPELLDTLALDFRDSGWNVKALLERLALSATYRQSAARRLSAEMIRDQALFVGGLLVEELGGPPVRPYQPAGLWKEKNGSVYQQDEGPGLWRRSLYTYWKRTSPPPSMMLFDATTRDVCVARRTTTSTPLQALALWNDPQQVEAARALAARTLHEEGANDDDARIARAFRRTTSRKPSDAERKVLARLLAEARAEFAVAPEQAAQLLLVGSAPPPADLAPEELAAWAVVAGTILASDAALVLR